MDFDMALTHKLSLPQAKGRTIAQIILDFDSEIDGLVTLKRWFTYCEMCIEDRDAIQTVLNHPVMKKSYRNANTFASAVSI